MPDAYALGARLDLSAAAPLAEALKARLGDDIIIDASAVTHIGALCLQVLLATAISAQAAGHEFEVRNASDRAVEQLAQMGFTPDSIGGVTA